MLSFCLCVRAVVGLGGRRKSGTFFTIFTNLDGEGDGLGEDFLTGAVSKPLTEIR